MSSCPLRHDQRLACWLALTLLNTTAFCVCRWWIWVGIAFNILAFVVLTQLAALCLKVLQPSKPEAVVRSKEQLQASLECAPGPRHVLALFHNVNGDECASAQAASRSAFLWCAACGGQANGDLNAGRWRMCKQHSASAVTAAAPSPCMYAELRGMRAKRHRRPSARPAPLLPAIKPPLQQSQARRAT